MRLQGSQRNEGQAEKNAAYVKKQQELSCAWTRSVGSCGECVNPTVSVSTFECACGPGGTCQVMVLMKAYGLELLMVHAPGAWRGEESLFALSSHQSIRHNRGAN